MYLDLCARVIVPMSP